MDGGNGNGKGRLTRDLICETALEAIDEAGLESLSMRTLASALGIKASSLYYHFGSKDGLLTGVAEFLYRKLGRPPSKGEWTEQVTGTFVQLRDFIQTHPNAAPLLVRDLAYSPVAKKRANVLLKIVARAGLDPDTSACLISNLVALLVGHTYLSLWVRQEGEAAKAAHGEERPDGVAPALGAAYHGDGSGDADADGSQIWVHRLFPATGALATGEHIESAATVYRGASKASGVALRSSIGLDSENAGDPLDDAGFLAGLDALIKGFTPD